MTADELRWYLHRRALHGARRGGCARPRSRTAGGVAFSPGAARDHRRRCRSKPNSTLRPLRFPTRLDPSAAAAVGCEARADLLAVADKLLTGRWEVLGVTRHDLDDPDWFYDPTTGRRAPQDRYTFDVRFRSESRRAT